MVKLSSLLAMCLALLNRLSDCSIGSVDLPKLPMSEALGSFTLKLYYGVFTNIRIITSVSPEKKTETLEIISDMVKFNLNSSMKVTLEGIESIKGSPSKRGSPMIVLIDSLKSFAKVREKLPYDNMKFRKSFMVVLVDGMFPGIEELMQDFWKHWIHNINVMSRTAEGNFALHTFFPFNEGSCGKNFQKKLVNTYDVRRHMWMTSRFYPDKFTNLNGCVLKVAAQAPSATPSVIMKVSDDGEKSFTGFEVKIFKEIVEEFNATTHFDDFETIGAIYVNGSVSPGILSAVFKKTHDSSCGTLSLQLERVQFLTETRSFLSNPSAIVIPPASAISPFKKLIRPLSSQVWIALLMLFVVGFAVIVILKNSSANFYEFVVGVGVKFPLLNMVNALFGGTQNKLPGKNFARFLLMKFLLFCLVIRCVYQGKLYIILQADLHENSASTIDEMMAQNMVFYTYESMKGRVQGFRITNRTVIIPNNAIEQYREKTLDPSFKGVVFSYLTQVLYINSLNYQNFTYLIAEETFTTNQLVFYFQRNHYLAEKFSDKIGQFYEHGLTTKIISRYVDTLFLRSRQQTGDTRSALKLSHLSAVFGVCLSGLTAATIVFILEVFWQCGMHLTTMEICNTWK